ncbi:hypothetical protein B296_00051804 [Ensete ventricosum]|uniref:Uncharacterized protein n=1 Tax=Ensete ventricosum TaxID=4639 RepID=A0A426X1B7_ENSVE|nr:hypothetical protein B296_00051804 [Ensete ventricosum]
MRIAIGYYCPQQLARATLLWIEVDKCWRIMLLQVVAGNGVQALPCTSSTRQRPMAGLGRLSYRDLKLCHSRLSS